MEVSLKTYLIISALIILFIQLVSYYISRKSTPKPKKKKVKVEKKVEKPKEEPIKEEPKEEIIEEPKEEIVEEPVVIEEPKVEESTSENLYINPLILDRKKYRLELMAKLEKEKKEKAEELARKIAEDEKNKNKVFQSKAGYISTLERFSPKSDLERQALQGSVDRNQLTDFLTSKNGVENEYRNLSPELKAIILSDLLKKKE